MGLSSFWRVATLSSQARSTSAEVTGYPSQADSRVIVFRVTRAPAVLAGVSAMSRTAFQRLEMDRGEGRPANTVPLWEPVGSSQGIRIWFP